MKYILKHKIILLFLFLLGIALLAIFHADITRNIRTYFFHERLVSFKTYNINFYVPTFLETTNELKTKNNNTYLPITTNDTTIHLYTTDRKLNMYYYQTGGVDMMFEIFTPWRAYTENIPYSLATHIAGTAKNVELYVYQGADGNGHGRGMLGSVHQGDINFSSITPQSIGLAFYCYDHDSGKNISSRCQQIISSLLQTIRYTPPIANNCFSTSLFNFCLK